MRVVLAGGPCTGKSTLIGELASRNFETVPEAARIIINEIKGGPALMPMTPARMHEMQRRIVLKQVELESKAPDSNIVFFDRSSFEVFAYCKFFDAQIPDELRDYIKNAKFDAVFILEPVCETKQDDVRFETPAEAKVIHGFIKDIYEEFNYKIINVPAIPVKERADFILKHLEVKNGK